MSKQSNSSGQKGAATADTALVALYRQFANMVAPVWWFADEHIADLPMPASLNDWQCFTNRCDIAGQLRVAGFITELSDFDTSAASSAPKTVCYRVSKEKALVHYLINQALSALPLGGQLVLAGHKNDGLHNYAKKAAALVGASAEIKKHDGSAYIATLTKASQPTEKLPDSDYTQIQEIAQAPSLFSKPGVFGWQKQDRGSALLIEQLPRFLGASSNTPLTVADLGCGYGYITVMAAQQLPSATWLLTDNNATALLAARKNCDTYGLKAEVVLADCAAGLIGPVDVVLCNPPFHQGFAVSGSLTNRFLAAAHRLLANQGRALFVVNQFIPLERKALGLFSTSEVLVEYDGFKVVQLQK
jgi:16S rRNA (guanine1207-N2)-methyltransferase